MLFSTKKKKKTIYTTVQTKKNLKLNGKSLIRTLKKIRITTFKFPSTSYINQGTIKITTEST